MNDKFIFLNYELWLPVVLMALVLWFVFIWKEWSTSSRKSMWSKVVVAFISVFALAIIALRPAIPVALDKGVGVLLTNGSDLSRLDSLKKAHAGLIKIRYSLGESMSKKLDSVSTVFILGHGIPSFDFWTLEGKSTTYLGSEPTSGITRLKYQREQTMGGTLVVDGRIKNTKPGNRLVLEAPGGATIDSVLMGSETQSFRLNADLKVAGNYVYALTEKDATGTVLSIESLPVKVLDGKGLNILMINSFPTFETKYLKNYLAEKRHKVLVRSQLTRGKYKFEYFNRERKPLYRITQSNLEQFDLLLIDAPAYRNLSANSNDELLKSIREDGLGVFIQPDNSFFGLPKSKSHFDFSRTRSGEARISKWPKAKFTVHPFGFEKELLIEPIHFNNTTIITAYRPLGKGRIGTTTLQNTFQQVLDGRSDSYQVLWSEIIEAISGKEDQVTEWEASAFPIYKNQPYPFQIRTVLASPNVTNTKGSAIPLRQDIDIPSLWSGTIYPRFTGWQLLKMESDTLALHEFYVQDTTAWKALNAQQIHNVNKRSFDGNIPHAVGIKSFKPISALWFFAIFVAGMGWLWLEPKLYG